MNTIITPPVRQYYVAVDGDRVLGYGYVDPDQRLDTDTPTLQTYTDAAAWNARLAELGVIPGDLWMGELPADAAQARLIIGQRINAIRADKLALDVTFMGYAFQGDATAVQNLSGVIGYLGVGGQLPESFCWRSSNNTDVPMQLPLLRGLAATMMAYRNACYVHSWTLKAQVDAAADPGAIDIGAGWPDNTNPLGA